MRVKNQSGIFFAYLEVVEDHLAAGRVVSDRGAECRCVQLVVHSVLDGAAQLVHQGVVLFFELWSRSACFTILST